jgi:hypothetical protein
MNPRRAQEVRMMGGAMPGPDYEMLRQRCCMKSQVELRLPPEPIAPTLARAAVAAVGYGLPEAVASDIELLTTEIVSNAVRHASLDPSEEIILRIVVDGVRPRRGQGSRPEYGP